MLSIPHLILIFVVALVIFGPEKLPELARNLGKVMGEFKRATGELRYNFEDHLREIERQADLRKIDAELPPAKPIENTIATSPPGLSAATAVAASEEGGSVADVPDAGETPDSGPGPQNQTATPVTADPAAVVAPHPANNHEHFEASHSAAGETDSGERHEDEETLSNGGSRPA